MVPSGTAQSQAGGGKFPTCLPLVLLAVVLEVSRRQFKKGPKARLGPDYSLLNLSFPSCRDGLAKVRSAFCPEACPEAYPAASQGYRHGHPALGGTVCFLLWKGLELKLVQDRRVLKGLGWGRGVKFWCLSLRETCLQQKGGAERASCKLRSN